ncbi:MAG: S-layer homology domain-containing protein, partial [Gudongella sp.]|nr:S-layer homology domain-containing protein [Gudongella sp.]
MNKRRILAIVMTAVMVLGIIPTAGFAVTDEPVMEFADMPDNWSTSALERAVQNGLLNGYTENGELLIKADAPLKRAELAAVVNRAFGATKVAELKGVT